MTIEACKKYCTAFVGIVAQGANGWFRNSDVIWFSSALTYFGSNYLNTNTHLRSSLNAMSIAKAVFIGTSIYNVMRSILDEPETHKNHPFESLKNKHLVLLANATAATLFLRDRFQFKASLIEIGLATLVCYGLTRMLHESFMQKKTSS